MVPLTKKSPKPVRATDPHKPKQPVAPREIPFGRPMISDAERDAVLRVLEGHTLTHGDRVREFEAAFASFTRAPHALATSTCTAALHLAYMYARLGPGDEVIVPAMTHVATAHAVELTGASCVFVDSEPRTGNIDIDQIESHITDRTRAISVVHFLGTPVEMDRVLAIGRQRNLLVIEDCALALGATVGNTHVGLLGDAGCFSFYPVKHITTAEGGMLITRHAELARRAALQRAFGIDRNDPEARVTPGLYDVQALGNNYRLNELSAAMGIEQMRRLSGFLEARRRNHQALASALEALDECGSLHAPVAHGRSAHYCYGLILKESIVRRRSEILAGLKARGIGVSLYYPMPVPHMAHYRAKTAGAQRGVPVAEWISRASIALPVGPHLDEGDMIQIARSLKDVIAGLS
jgi:dTDP-4-amino-4,6-dideoxygalactose transaminase